jgi:hypothetical protein
MGKFTLYLKENDEEQLLKLARHSGQTPTEFLRKMAIAWLSENKQNQIIEKLDAIFDLLSLTAEENSFTGGATRAAVKNNENVTREGLLFESNMRRTILSIRASFAPKRSDL